MWGWVIVLLILVFIIGIGLVSSEPTTVTTSSSSSITINNEQVDPIVEQTKTVDVSKNDKLTPAKIAGIVLLLLSMLGLFIIIYYYVKS